MNKLQLSVVAFALLCLSVTAFAQQYPYPRSFKFKYGYMSSNITSQDANSEYEGWISSYYVECSGSEARIDYNGNTVSEGIGYGMVITAYAGDQDKFDKLWNYYKKRRNGSGVMNWEYPGCQTNPSGDNGATDGDLDAVMGLLVAVHQWPNKGYESQFEELVGDIRKSEFVDECEGMVVQKPGDVWGGCECTNPSYYAPGYYRAFAAYFKEKGDSDNASFWTRAADDAYTILFRNQNSSTGLVSAWTNSSGAAGPCGGAVGGGGGADTYQYDACRTPWRIAVDYLWWGSSDAKKFLEPIVGFVNTKVGGIENVVDGYKLDGTETGQWHNVPFVGSFALAAMSTSQADADTYMKHFVTVKGENYFNTCLSLMYKFLATGNFWNPYDGDKPDECSSVALGEQLSLCGEGSVELDAGVGTHADRKFTWYKDGAEQQSGSSNLFSANQAGTYKVVMDSAGACSSEAEVVLSATMPEVDLGETVMITNGTELDAGIEGNGITYKWFFNGTEIQGQTQKTLAIDEAGTYAVEVSATGCSTVSDEVVAKTLPSINRTSQQITIDGSADAYYQDYSDLKAALVGNEGAPDIAASWSALWDNSNLYVIVKIIDNDLQNDSGDSWYFDDAVEIFVDGDNSKGDSYDNSNDFQWGIRWNSNSVNAGGSNPGNSTAGIEYEIAETENGYNIEVAIPWSTINVTPSEGHTIGFDVALNDDDGGGERENKISWNAQEDNAWQNPSLFGSVNLKGEKEIPTQSQTLNFRKGWNLAAISIQPQNSDISAVMPNVRTVKTLDRFYEKDLPPFVNSLTEIEAGKAYLVYVENDQQVVIEGVRPEPVVPVLETGWNLVASPVSVSTSVQEAFGNEIYNIQIIKTFDEMWQDGGGSMQNIKPDTAYFVKRN